MKEQYMNDELEERGRGLILRNDSGIRLKGLRKTTKYISHAILDTR
jgi:hypothetical protein